MALFLQRLWEALGGDCDDTATPFTDIGLYSADKRAAIACIYWLGVTTGTGDGTTYSPEDFVTRQQMAAFLARLWRTAVDEGFWS